MRSVILLFAICLLSACASTTAPDLTRLYASQAGAGSQPPLIVVHGIMGGRLANKESGNEIWPGSLRRVLFSDYRSLRLEIDPETLASLPSTLEVSGITDKAAGQDFYGRILTVLESAGRYRRGTPGERVTHSENRYYVYAYDWRRDNLESARGLHDLIEQIRRDYDDPELKVDVIAHSMGGLITRYYVRYGTDDVLNDNDFPVNNVGASRIRRVILLGTPNFGSAQAMRTLDRGFRIGLGTLPAEVLATFPSAYQLLPHALNNWLVDENGERLEEDQFDIDFWRDNQLSIFTPEVRQRVESNSGADYFALLERAFERNIERARRFTWSLTVPVPDPQVRYVVFGGDCMLTSARGMLQKHGDRSVVQVLPSEVTNRKPGVDYEEILLEPGDGTVTKASLTARQTLDPTIPRHEYSFFPLAHSIFLCEGHAALTGNISFQDNLLNELLSVDP